MAKKSGVRCTLYYQPLVQVPGLRAGQVSYLEGPTGT